MIEQTLNVGTCSLLVCLECGYLVDTDCSTHDQLCWHGQGMWFLCASVSSPEIGIIRAGTVAQSGKTSALWY